MIRAHRVPPARGACPPGWRLGLMEISFSYLDSRFDSVVNMKNPTTRRGEAQLLSGSTVTACISIVCARITMTRFSA